MTTIAIILFLLSVIDNTCYGMSADEILKRMPSPEVNYKTEKSFVQPESIKSPINRKTKPSAPIVKQKSLPKKTETKTKEDIKKESDTPQIAIQTELTKKDNALLSSDTTKIQSNSIINNNKNVTDKKINTGFVTQEKTATDTFISTSTPTIIENKPLNIKTNTIVSATQEEKAKKTVDNPDKKMQSSNSKTSIIATNSESINDNPKTDKKEISATDTSKLDFSKASISKNDEKNEKDDDDDEKEDNNDEEGDEEEKDEEEDKTDYAQLIKSSLNKKRINYNELKGYAEKQLSKNPSDPTANYANALCIYNSKKPNYSKAYIYITKALKAKRPPNGASLLKWKILVYRFNLIYVFLAILVSIIAIIYKKKKMQAEPNSNANANDETEEKITV